MPAPSATLAMVPASAIGTWRLEVTIESGNRPVRRGRNDPRATMTLSSRSAQAAMMGGPQAQFAATIAIPGYSRPARRGRAQQQASWWPLAGDSLVVQFAHGTDARGEVQLRGQLRDGALRGEMWYLSTGTGSTYQLGSFSGVKTR